MDLSLSRANVTIGTTRHTLVAIKPVESKRVEQKQFHHVHVLDRSGSMCRDIGALIDNVQATLKEIAKGDIISIIWFSSPGEYRTLVKGAQPSDNLIKLLDSLRSTLGTTCFSDPIKEIEAIVDELYELCPNISVTFFTDGEPVIPCHMWSIEEEKKRIFAGLNRLKNKIVAVNTIGYGYGYKQDLLRDMASTTEYGVFIHSAEIRDYKDIFVKNYEVLSGTISEPICIESAGEMVFLSENFTKLTEDRLEMTRLAKSGNAFFVLGKGDFSITINNEIFKTASIKEEIEESLQENFLYAYAYNLFYNGKRQKCLDILAKNIKDKYFVDKQMSVFTFDEAADYQIELGSAVYSTALRFKEGKCPKDYLPKHNAHCVMDVLMTLAEEGAYYLPVHAGAEKYERITRSSVDAEDRFKRSNAPVLASFEDFVFAEDRMNLSIRFTIPGTVSINPKTAQRVGLEDEFPSYIYNTYTIIKDGTLHVKKVIAAVSEGTYDTLKKAGTNIVKLVIDATTASAFAAKGIADYSLVCIDLGKLPITNRSYLSKGTNMSKIFGICNKTIRDEAIQKWLGHYIKEIEKLEPSKEGVFRAYTDEQTIVLQEHGVDKSGAYRGVKKTVTSSENSDSYEIKSLSFTFSGVSSLPSINEVNKQKASKKEATLRFQIMLDAEQDVQKLVTKAGYDINKLTTELKTFLEQELKKTRGRLRVNRYWLGGLKLAKMLTGDWFEELVEADDKGNYLYKEDNKILLVKPEVITEYL